MLYRAVLPKVFWAHAPFQDLWKSHAPLAHRDLFLHPVVTRFFVRKSELDLKKRILDPKSLLMSTKHDGHIKLEVYGVWDACSACVRVFGTLANNS